MLTSKKVKEFKDGIIKEIGTGRDKRRLKRNFLLSSCHCEERQRQSNLKG